MFVESGKLLLKFTTDMLKRIGRVSEVEFSRTGGQKETGLLALLFPGGS